MEEGKEFFLRGDYHAALGSFEQALALDPGNNAVLFEIGKIYHVLGEYPKSVEYLRRSVSMLDENDPRRRDQGVLLAKSLASVGDYNAAVAVLKPLVRPDADDYPVEKELKRIFNQKYSVQPGACDTAGYVKLSEEYRQKAARNPSDLTSIAHLANMYNFQGLYHLTIPLIQKTLPLVPDADIFFKNKLTNELEIAQGKTVLESKVRSITVTLSNRCNISCIMCQTSKHPWELPRERVDELISLFPYLEKVMWQGGEVFYLDYFPELLRAAYRYPNLRQSIVTNGQLLTDEIAEDLVKNNVELTFSVDGACKETYEYIRRGARYETLVHAIQTVARLRKHHQSNLVMNMNVVVMRSNYKELKKLVEFAGANGFEFVCLMPLHTHLATPEDIFTNPDTAAIDFLRKEIGSIEKAARDLGLRLENRLSLPVEKNVNIGIPQACRHDVPDEPAAKSGGGKKYLCHLPWFQLLLDYDGTVRPDCLCGVDRNAGSLQTVSIAEAWNSPVMREYRSNLSGHKHETACNMNCITGKINETHLKSI